MFLAHSPKCGISHLGNPPHTITLQGQKEPERRRYFGSPLEMVAGDDGVPVFVKMCAKIIEDKGGSLTPPSLPHTLTLSHTITSSFPLHTHAHTHTPHPHHTHTYTHTAHLPRTYTLHTYTLHIYHLPSTHNCTHAHARTHAHTHTPHTHTHTYTRTYTHTHMHTRTHTHMHIHTHTRTHIYTEFI